MVAYKNCETVVPSVCHCAEIKKLYTTYEQFDYEHYHIIRAVKS